MSISDLITSLMNEESFSLALISFDRELINSIVDLLLTFNFENSLILSVLFLRQNPDFKIELENKIDTKFKIIKSDKFIENQSKCIFFGDFNNSIFLTETNIDFVEKIIKNNTYRKNCKYVIMYNYTGSPPLNGYWKFDRKIDDNIYLLSLSEWGSICQNIPHINLPEAGLITYENISNLSISTHWLNELKNFLRYLIPLIMGTVEFLEEILSNENMIVWVKCFIHETFNVIYGYQLLEFLGDKICSIKFTEYMIAKYERLTESEATEYHNQYMSKNHQYYLADDLNLIKFLLADFSVFTPSKKDKTDIFESFVGALYQTCQTINISIAECATSNFFTLIGEQFSFERNMTFGVPKHRVIQIIESLGFNPGEDFKLEVDRQNQGKANALSTIFLKFSHKFLEYMEILKSSGHDISGIISVIMAFSPHKKTEGSQKAEFWDKIIRIFDFAGVDLRFAKNERQNIFNFIHRTEVTLYNILIDKIFSLNEFRDYNRNDFKQILDRIHFQSNKKDKDDENNYVIMYLNSFSAQPNSKLLNSMRLFSSADQKSGDDYLNPISEDLQKINLAVVRTPELSEEKNGEVLNPFRLACYNCVLKFCST